jgi:hypothetical protein
MIIGLFRNESVSASFMGDIFLFIFSIIISAPFFYMGTEKFKNNLIVKTRKFLISLMNLTAKILIISIFISLIYTVLANLSEITNWILNLVTIIVYLAQSVFEYLWPKEGDFIKTAIVSPIFLWGTLSSNGLYMLIAIGLMAYFWPGILSWPANLFFGIAAAGSIATIDLNKL